MVSEEWGTFTRKKTPRGGLPPHPLSGVGFFIESVISVISQIGMFCRGQEDGAVTDHGKNDNGNGNISVSVTCPCCVGYQ